MNLTQFILQSNTPRSRAWARLSSALPCSLGTMTAPSLNRKFRMVQVFLDLCRMQKKAKQNTFLRDVPCIKQPPRSQISGKPLILHLSDILAKPDTARRGGECLFCQTKRIKRCRAQCIYSSRFKINQKARNNLCSGYT